MHYLVQRRIQALFMFFMVALFMGALTGCFEKEGPTPTQQMVGIFDQYNFQYNDYMVQTGNIKVDGKWEKVLWPEFTDAQKNVLKNKKKVLTAVYPLIKLCDNFVITGGTIPPDLMSQILTMLNQLLIL